jgi:putative transposase
MARSYSISSPTYLVRRAASIRNARGFANADRISVLITPGHDRRRGSKKAKLRWRSNKRSLGWVPFKNQTISINGSIVTFNGRKIRLWLHREIEGEIKSGSFSEDARGRWYCNIVVEYDPIPTGANAEVGIDLGLKAGMTRS